MTKKQLQKPVIKQSEELKKKKKTAENWTELLRKTVPEVSATATFERAAARPKLQPQVLKNSVGVVKTYV